MPDYPLVGFDTGPHGGTALNVRESGTVAVASGGTVGVASGAVVAVASGGSVKVASGGEVRILSGGKIIAGTATAAAGSIAVLPTATLSDTNIAAAALAINSIKTALVNVGILTST